MLQIRPFIRDQKCEKERRLKKKPSLNPEKNRGVTEIIFERTDTFISKKPKTNN